VHRNAGPGQTQLGGDLHQVEARLGLHHDIAGFEHSPVAQLIDAATRELARVAPYRRG
jgi:hypothetical protein